MRRKAKYVIITDPSNSEGARTIYQPSRCSRVPIEVGAFTPVTDLTVSFGKGTVISCFDLRTNERRAWILTSTVPVIVELEMGEEDEN